MDRWPASSPQPAVAAVFRALVVVALVVPMDRGMVMTDHDELLARVDVMLDMIRRRDTAAVPGVVSLLRDLRAALAARPQPDEPTALDMVTDLHRAMYGDTWGRAESPRQVWDMLIAQVRGFATQLRPLTDAYAVIRQLTEGGPEADPDWDPADYGWSSGEAAVIRAAVAGSVTPTGDDDG